jgi:hypothetical protein
MTSDWDGTLEALRGAAPAPAVEHVLWILTKTGRTAEARVRPHPLGQELRFLVNGELLWSEVFRSGRGVVLGEVAENKRLDFIARGWLWAE